MYLIIASRYALWRHNRRHVKITTIIHIPNDSCYKLFFSSFSGPYYYKLLLRGYGLFKNNFVRFLDINIIKKN